MVKIKGEYIVYDKIIGMHNAGAERAIKPTVAEYCVYPYDNCKEVTLTIYGPTLDFSRKGYQKDYSYVIPYSQFDNNGKLKVGKNPYYSFDGKRVRFYSEIDILKPIEDEDEDYFIQYDKLYVVLKDADITKPLSISGRSYRKEIMDKNCLIPCISFRKAIPCFNSSFNINVLKIENV